MLTIYKTNARNGSESGMFTLKMLNFCYRCLWNQYESRLWPTQNRLFERELIEKNLCSVSWSGCYFMIEHCWFALLVCNNYAHHYYVFYPLGSWLGIESHYEKIDIPQLFFSVTFFSTETFYDCRQFSKFVSFILK